MASKSNGMDAHAAEWSRAPPSGPLWLRMLKSIYNPDEKSFLGRTAKRWGILLVFYTVFYAVLALLFALCMGGLFMTIDARVPKYTLKSSLIGANPGVAFRPLSETNVNKYSRQNDTAFGTYVQQMDEFLEPYAQQSWFKSQHECTSNDSYGYPDTPCFFVKINKIFDWEPELYDDESSLPADMPEDLKEHILSLNAPMRKKIWISCWEDKDNTTKVEYPWGRGLPARYYPFRNEDGYVSPLVAVKLLPAVNTLTTIRCRAWAKNIIYNKSIKDPSGYTLIQLFIEDSESANADSAAD